VYKCEIVGLLTNSEY